MSKNTLYSNISIGEIVANDFRLAEVFKEAGIDFCCGGKKSIESTCIEKSINPVLLMEQLSKFKDTPINQVQNFNEWDLAFLCDYIANTHHKYVLKSLPELVFYTRKIADVHGSNHSELMEVANLIEKINAELLQHLNKEEQVLFPAIKKVLKTNSIEGKALIKSEIARMTGEHEFAGGAMDKINEITNAYEIPSDACNTYLVTYKMLKQFEDDLHVHVHLENNILFPKAIKL